MLKDSYTGRIISKTMTFKQNVEDIDGAFVAISKAEQYLKSMGYVVGSMCMDMPMGFAKSDKVNYIAKWRNIPKEDYSKLDGIIIPFKPNDIERHGFRDSWVKILFFEEV